MGDEKKKEEKKEEKKPDAPKKKPGLVQSLASTNLAVLMLRLMQFFFAGVVTGIMAYFIKTQKNAGTSPANSYTFSLVVGVTTMFTQFLYCANLQLLVLFFWDAAIATGWILAMFWLRDYESPLPCAWSAFNPFGSSHCGQVRAVMAFQIVSGCLWYLSAAVGAFNWYSAGQAGKKAAAEKKKKSDKA